MNSRTISLIFFISLVHFSSLFSQTTFSTRIGISTITQVQLEGISAISENRFIYSNIGYAFSSLEGPGCATVFSINKDFDGFNLKIGITKTKEKLGKYIKNRGHTFSIFYRRLNGENWESESLCGGYNNTRYENTINDIGLSFIRDRNLDKGLTFYWSISVVKRFHKKSSYSRLTNMQESENINRYIILLDIGFRLKLISNNTRI